MRKINNKLSTFLLYLILTFGVLLTGCKNPLMDVDNLKLQESATKTSGSLILSTGYISDSRTIAPASDLKSLVASYNIEFSNHSGSEENFTVDSYTEGSEIVDIAVGTWTISLTGSDSEGNVICSGSPDDGNPVTISEGENALSVTLEPVSGAGNGELEYIIDFPPEDVDSVTVSIDPWPINDDDAYDLTEGTDYNSDFATTGELSINCSLESGQYFLTVTFGYDPGGVYIPVEYAPISEIVQIYNNLTSSAVLELTIDDLTQPPDEPTGFIVKSCSDRIELSWNDSSHVEEGFRLERKLDTDTEYALLTELGSNTTEYIDTGVNEGDTASYRIAAYNAFGQSAWAELVVESLFNYSSFSKVANNINPATDYQGNWYGQYFFAKAGSELVVLDISEASAPVEIASYPYDNTISKPVINGDMLYLVERSVGVRSYTIASDSGLTEKCLYENSLGLSLETAGDYLVLTCLISITSGIYNIADREHLEVLDISSQEAITLAASYYSEDIVCDSYFDGGYLYLVEGPVSGSKSLISFDLNAPSGLLTPLSTITLVDTSNDSLLGKYGDYLYVPRSNYLEIVSVADPTTLQYVAQINDSALYKYADFIDFYNGYGYTITYTSGSYYLVLLDMTDPELPTSPGTLKIGNISGVAFSDDLLMTNKTSASSQGLSYIVDISNPLAFSISSTYIRQASSVEVDISSDYAFVGTAMGVQIFDISNPIAPSEIAILSPGSVYVSVSGNYVYTGSGTNCYVWDISNISAPVFVSEVSTSSNICCIRAGSGVLALGLPSGSIDFFDISSTPGNPVSLGSVYCYIDSNYDMQIAGTNLYSFGFHYLSIMDLSDVSSISRTSLLELPGEGYGGSSANIAGLVDDNIVYASGLDVVSIVDVSDETAPVLISSIEMDAGQLAIRGDFLFASRGLGSTIRIFDVSELSAPVYLRGFTESFIAEDMLFHGDYMFVTGGAVGLMVFGQ